MKRLHYLFLNYFYILVLLFITVFLAIPFNAKTIFSAFSTLSEITANNKIVSSQFSGDYTSSTISSDINKTVNNTYSNNSVSESINLYSKINAASSRQIQSNSKSAQLKAKSTAPHVQTLSKKLIIGYYGGWSAYNGFTPDKINASHLNCLNYSFAEIGSDLKITVEDTAVDYSNFIKLNKLKAKYTGLRTVIAVGGWDGSQNFSAATATPLTRQIFAQSCIDFVKKYGFDGINIDWEYPCSGGKIGNTESSYDKSNFTALLQELRRQLDTLSSKACKHYILSIAGGAGNGYLNNIEPKKIKGFLDYAVVMTYDIHGSFDKYSDFNAPLYSPALSSPQFVWSGDASVKAWVNKGFPAAKLLLGVPFYGYVYNVTSIQNNGLFQPFTACKAAGYDTIFSKYLSSTAFTKQYQPQAMVPYMFNATTFISYDDSASLAQKAKYALNNRLGGVSAWELSFDRCGVLLNALYKAMK
jgi:chitinase